MIAKKQLGYIPIFGWALYLSGMVMVDRDNHRAALLQLEKTAKIIHDGRPLFISPEGTRSVTGALLPFKKGGFVIALKAGVPVVPVIIRGARAIQSRAAFRINPGKVTIEFLPPVSTEGMGIEQRDELIVQVRVVFVAEMGRPGDLRLTLEQK